MSRMRRLRQQRRGVTIASKRDGESYKLIYITRIVFFIVAVCAASAFLSYFSNNNAPRGGQRQGQLDHPIFSSPEEIPLEIVLQLDAILVLEDGGVLESSIQSPLLPDHVQRLYDDAAKVVQRYSATMADPTTRSRAENIRMSFRRRSRERTSQSSNGDNPSQPINEKQDVTTLPILCLSEGTVAFKSSTPSSLCVEYLTEHYQLSTNVFVETSWYGRERIRNAYLARTSHTDITGWRRLLIVTNEVHMTHTKSIFDWIFQDLTDSPPNPSPISQRSRGRRRRRHEEDSDTSHSDGAYQLYYLSSPNVGVDASSIAAHQQKEIANTKFVQDVLAPQYQSLKQVHWFLTHGHSLNTSSTHTQ